MRVLGGVNDMKQKSSFCAARSSRQILYFTVVIFCTIAVPLRISPVSQERKIRRALQHTTYDACTAVFVMPMTIFMFVPPFSSIVSHCENEFIVLLLQKSNWLSFTACCCIEGRSFFTDGTVRHCGIVVWVRHFHLHPLDRRRARVICCNPRSEKKPELVRSEVMPEPTLYW